MIRRGRGEGLLWEVGCLLIRKSCSRKKVWKTHLKCEKLVFLLASVSNHTFLGLWCVRHVCVAMSSVSDFDFLTFGLKYFAKFWSPKFVKPPTLSKHPPTHPRIAKSTPTPHSKKINIFGVLHILPCKMSLMFPKSVICCEMYDIQFFLSQENIFKCLIWCNTPKMFFQEEFFFTYRATRKVHSIFFSLFMLR